MATTAGAETPATTSPPAESDAQGTMPSSSSPVETSELKIASAPAVAQGEEEKDEEEEKKDGLEQDTLPGAQQEPASTFEPPQPDTETEKPPATLSPLPPTGQQAEPDQQEEKQEPTIPPTKPQSPSQSQSADPTTPTLSITLMLTTGVRHPYKIDSKYLRTRKVEAINPLTREFDPREMSGYKLKELIWTDWRGEWEPRPASPSSIRLIILGRLVEDKLALKEFPFKLDDTNVVHMTVKPADFLDDDDTGGKKGHPIRGGLDGEERDAGCCRCVIL